MAMTVKKNDNEVRIQWRVADIKIPNNEIKMLLKIKIFMPYQKRMVKKYLESVLLSKTNRVLIDTDQHLYIIYTQNDQKYIMS